MKSCKVIVTSDDGKVLTTRDLPHEVHAAPNTSSRDKSNAKRALSLLCDYQTKADMSEDELRRFASAKRMVRKRNFARAKAVLSSPRPACAESLNLLGVIHESLKEFDAARKCYGDAGLADKDCTAAQMNARRIYELHTFGHSDIPLYL